MKVTQPIILSASFMRVLREESTKSRLIELLYRTLCNINVGRASSVTGRWHIRPSRILSDQMIGTHFTFREKKGLISYMPAGKEQAINDDCTWAIKGRQATSPGKWLRSMFSDRAIERLKIADHEFAHLSTAIKHLELADELTILEVPFEQAYRKANYPEEIHSCMWDKPVGSFYRLFDAKAVVCRDGTGAFRARAVVWHNVRHATGTIVLMDRIYSAKPEIETAMKEFAAHNGWCFKARQGSGCSDGYISPEGPIGSTASVRSLCGDIEEDYYPYLDTFQYGDCDNLSTRQCDHYTYASTDGGREDATEDDHEGEVQDVDGEWIGEDDAYNVDGDYYHRDDSRIVWCKDEEYHLRSECCKVDGDWYPENSDDIVYSDPQGEYLLAEDATYVEGEYYSSDSDDIVYSEDVGDHIPTADAVEIDGNWYRTTSNKVCTTENGDAALKEDCVQLEDGTWLLEEDAYERDDGTWIRIGDRTEERKWDEGQLPLGVVVDEVVVDGRVS